MTDKELVIMRYGYTEDEADRMIGLAVALANTGLGDFWVAMEMLYRLQHPGDMKWDTREHGWHYV